MFLYERRRISSCPSSAGIDELGRLPSNRQCSHWPDIIGLVRGVPPETIRYLDALQFWHCGSNNVEVEEIPPGFSTREEWEVADPETRGCLVRYTMQVALDPPLSVVGRRFGVTATHVRRAVSDAYMTVAINIAMRAAR